MLLKGYLFIYCPFCKPLYIKSWILEIQLIYIASSYSLEVMWPVWIMHSRDRLCIQCTDTHCDTHCACTVNMSIPAWMHMPLHRPSTPAHVLMYSHSSACSTPQCTHTHSPGAQMPKYFCAWAHMSAQIPACSLCRHSHICVCELSLLVLTTQFPVTGRPHAHCNAEPKVWWAANASLEEGLAGSGRIQGSTSVVKGVVSLLLVTIHWISLHCANSPRHASQERVFSGMPAFCQTALKMAFEINI